MTKIIAIAVPKGGVGKTTTAVNLAASLAVAEKQTLLIDFDPSGACSTYLGFNTSNIEGDIFDVFSFSKHISKVIHKTELINLDFIPLNVNTLQKEERLNRLTNNNNLFCNILNSDELMRYDFIILDCPPYVKGLTTIALAAADSILIPVKAGQFSIAALKKMFNHIKWIKDTLNRKLKIEGILLTMYEPGTKAWQMTNEELIENFGDYLLKTIIPKNIAMTESEFFGKPAILFNATAKGSLAYLELAHEILNESNEARNTALIKENLIAFKKSKKNAESEDKKNTDEKNKSNGNGNGKDQKENGKTDDSDSNNQYNIYQLSFLKSRIDY